MIPIYAATARAAATVGIAVAVVLGKIPGAEIPASLAALAGVAAFIEAVDRRFGLRQRDGAAVTEFVSGVRSRFPGAGDELEQDAAEKLSAWRWAADPSVT